MAAAKQGDICSVQTSIECGALITCQDEMGRTVSHIAGERGDFNIIKIISNHGEDLGQEMEHCPTFTPVSMGKQSFAEYKKQSPLEKWMIKRMRTLDYTMEQEIRRCLKDASNQIIPKIH